MNVICRLVGPQSAVDVGCGVGTFLKVFAENGVAHIAGLDSGQYVEQSQMVIPHEAFIDCDLNSPPELEQRFDVCLSLEVAEHIRPENAGAFVEFLCSLSDCVCFSAAIPGQGGKFHVNEQWQSYWLGLFDTNG